MKLTTQNQIMDTLQWSADEYEQRMFLAFLHWCQHYGGYPSMMQQLLANARVNKWFRIEYEKLEKQFLKITEIVPPKSEQMAAHYKACTAEIMTIYPKPLIEGIKRNRDFSNLYVASLPVYYAN